MPFRDSLLGLKALFLESPEAKDGREALLARKAPGLTRAERDVLLAIPAERIDVYVGLLRDNQAAMLKFVAPSAVEAIAKFAGVPEKEVARATLVETPRRTSRMRELSQRLVDHLEGPFGAPIAARCPAVLDLARLERAAIETFYAPDDDGSMTPPEFAARVESSTVDEVLALVARPGSSVRIASLPRDVLAWRDRRFETGSFDDPPPLLPAPIEVLCARDPGTLQPVWHRVEPALLPLVRPSEGRPFAPLEALAGEWVEATGSDPDDPQAPAKFFEQTAIWVRAGVLAVRA